MVPFGLTERWTSGGGQLNRRRRRMSNRIVDRSSNE